MKIPKTLFGKYFKKSIYYLSKSKLVFLIISVIEFMEVLICLLDYQDFFFLLDKNYHNTQTQLAKLLLSIIPYSYYFDYFIDQNSSGFSIVYITLLIYAFLVISFLIYLILGTKESNEEIKINKTLNNIIDKVCINFFDLFLFRLAPLYGINSIVRGIFKILRIKNYNAAEIIVQFLFILFLVFIIFIHYCYFSNVCIWNNFKVIDTCFSKYPYEIFYSKKYDIAMFTLKLIIVLAKNYVNYNNNIANFLVIFLTLLLEFIFFGFAFYTIYLLFFSKNALYFYLNFYNKVRIFLLLFMIEALVLRFGLHSNDDYIPYLTFMAIFLIFNFYVILSILDSYILATAINSQNYVGVCWFIQGNDVDIQNFTIEWITNHRDYCILDIEQCPICSKLKLDFDIYSEECMQLLENGNNNNKSNNNKEGNNINSRIKHNKISIVKKRNMIKRTMIDKMFPSYRFFTDLIKLAEKSKKFISKNDLIRLDILYIIALFYNEKKNIYYYFYTKVCFLLIKYKKNSQVLMTLILISEIMQKESVYSSQKLEIIKKNEELRYSLEEYIKDFSGFLLYNEKSPINYFNSSKQYRKFKDLLKTIQVYFKKNIECDYELILMRYIYETLVHQNFKNMQPFDLNNYADFIEYHYSNSKSFIIKNIIDQDIFIIVKGSKEILKYQNEHFDILFPSEFQNDAINRFKTKLSDLYKKEINPLFEYVINSFSSYQQFGFVDLFKMRYIIYPTNLINELYIQVSYIVGYNNVIIFEKNEYGFDVLHTFSPKLYKIFGIYPSDIDLLKKTGINICFNDIFIRSDKNKDNQEQDRRHIYIFKYERYLLLLKRLLIYDILKDTSNYKQILDKKNEFESMRETKKEIIFQLSKKWEYKTNSNKVYKFFSIKETKKIKPGITNIKNNSSIYSSISKNFFENLNKENDEEDSDENEFEILKEDEFVGRGMTMAGSTLSSTSLTKSFENSENGKQKGKKDEKLDEKRKKKEELERYTYILLCLSIIIIIITVIFLIMVTNQNNQFRKVSNLFIVFRVFKRGIERFPLTMLSNFQIYYKNNTSINVYEEYSKYLGEKSAILKNYLISDVLIQELITRIDVVMESFSNYQREIHKLGSSLAEKINVLSGNEFQVFVQDDTIMCRAVDLNLIVLFRRYLNVISALLKDNSFYGKEFPLVNFNDLDSVYSIIETDLSYDTHITSTIKNMFLLSLSYPYSHNGLVNTINIILDEDRKIINLITNILIIFFLILIILHVVLGFIAMLFITSFINILKLNISDSNIIFEDKKFLEFHQRRLEQIKIMKNLYCENPIKIADKICVIEEFYKRKKNEINEKESNKSSTNDITTNNLSNKKLNDNESVKDEKSEISKKTGKKNDQNNITTFNSKDEPLNDSENKNNPEINKNTDFKDIKFAEIKFEKGITSKNIKLNQKQFLPILIIQYILVYIIFGFYFIYSIILFILVFISGIKILTHLVNYAYYNDLIEGYIYDNSNVLLFMIQTNSTSFYYGNITHPGRTSDYMEEAIDLLYEAIIGKEDIEIYKENIFKPIDNLMNLNCSEKIIKDDDFTKVADKMGFDYDNYFGELCKIFPAAQSGSDALLYHEILYLVEQVYRKFSTNESYEYIFEEYLNQTQLYDLFTITLTFNRIQRNYFNSYYFPDEISGVLNYFALLMYIYLVISVILEILIFLVIYLGIIVQVKKKYNLIISFSESLKYE